MSGAEAIAIIGLISSVITIIETSRDLYDVASSATGLHAAFRAVAQNVPLILSILRDCKTVQESLDMKAKKPSTDATHQRELDDSAEAVKPVMLACRENAQKLKDMLEKVVPGEEAGWFERYMKAAKSVAPGKRQKVEDLMKEMLEKLQLLHTSRFFKGEVEKRAKQLETAISELSDLEPSLPDETTGQFSHSGAGSMNINTGKGKQVNNTQSGGKDNKQFISDSMSFGKDY